MHWPYEYPVAVYCKPVLGASSDGLSVAGRVTASLEVASIFGVGVIFADADVARWVVVWLESA